MRPCLSKSYVRRSNHKSHDAPKNSLFTDDIVENCEEIEYLSMGLYGMVKFHNHGVTVQAVIIICA